jgi:phage protein D/phage baseplate assembly protein gpV
MDAQKHVASASIKVKGARLELEDMDAIEKIEVRNFVGLPDVATIRMADPQGRHVGDPPFFIGDEIEIQLGGIEASSPTSVFSGEVVAFEPEFTHSAALICVRAYDKSHRLHRNRRSATFQDMTLTDVVRKLVGDNALPSGTIESTPTVHPFLQQSMETDLDFINRLAAMENCEFGFSAGKAFLQQRRNGAGAVPTLSWKENAKSFKPRMTAAQQHDKVRVASYDPKSRKAVVGEATEPGAIPGAAKEARDKASSFGASELLVADRIANSADEARTIAQSTLDKLASGSFEADGVMEGDPAVKAGGKLKLAGFGRFDGEHHLSSVTHVYGHGDFRTRFAISGRNPRTLTDVMRPKAERAWTAGLVVGIVTNINDPESLGRVRVKFPSLGDDIEGGWARVALVGAGKNAGMSFMPQLDDEVVVGFEHGDTRRPVVLGALHNGVDKPHAKMRGDQDGGSLVVYGRKDGEINLQKQLVITAKEHMVIKVDSGDYKLEASDKLEVKAGSTIKLESTGEMTLKSTAGITLEASGPLKLKGATVDIEASATVNVKGSLINIG